MMTRSIQPATRKFVKSKPLPLGLPLAAAAVGTVASLYFGKKYHVVFGIAWLALSVLHGIQHAGKMKHDAKSLAAVQ